MEYLSIGRPDTARTRAAQIPEVSKGMAIGYWLVLKEHWG